MLFWIPWTCLSTFTKSNGTNLYQLANTQPSQITVYLLTNYKVVGCSPIHCIDNSCTKTYNDPKNLK